MTIAAEACNSSAMGHLRAPLDVILAQPRGFCAGVVRAIDIVERALSIHGAPVYVRHQIVHNHHVVASLQSRGAIFVSDVSEIPPGAVTVFSAHGVAKSVEAAAAERRLDVIDATCPLVRKVHMQARRYVERGYDVVLIGHAGHPEVEGTRGQVPNGLHIIAEPSEVATLPAFDPERVAYVTQTTLSVRDTRDVIAALKARFPAIVGPDVNDICYATQNRQAAVIAMAPAIDALLVIGAANSSNSNRLREIGEAEGVNSRLIPGPEGLDFGWLSGARRLGLTAGASAPETLVDATIRLIATRRDVSVRSFDGVVETMAFRLPARLEPAAVGSR
jgi:4-hydroxy-3-methylbut-2-enyl diphosphate reductase